MLDHLLTIGFLVFLGWGLLSGMGRSENPRVWSGDTADEEARRNTRTDSNYRGYDHWNTRRIVAGRT